MHVRVKLFATLRQYLPSDTQGDVYDVEIPAGTRVIRVLSQLDVPVEKPESMVVLVNGRQSDLNHVLNDGDVVSAFPAMAGG